jgi:hypothetical protein
MATLKDEDLAYIRDLPGFDRGNPAYFENEVIDHLVSIVLELGAQLWVTRDRLALLEEQLAGKGAISLKALEEGRPSDELAARLKAERQAMIQQVYARLYSRYGGDKIDHGTTATAPM